MKIAAFWLLLFLCFAGAGRAQNLDITGISLGSPYADAVAKLAAQGFHNSPVKFPDDWQQMTATLASKKAPYGDGKQHLVEDFVVQALNGKVVYVNHAIVFDVNAKPNDQDTVNSLKAKYGQKPTLENNPQTIHEAGSWSFDWTFNANGIVVSELGPDRLSCGVGGGQLSGGVPGRGDVSVVSTIGTGIQCSRWASARIYGDIDHQGQLVNSMYVKVADVSALKAFFTALRKSRQDQMNKVGDAGKQNKAPL